MEKYNILSKENLYKVSNQKYIILIFLVCACTCYFFIYNDAPFFGGDTKQYLEVAQDIRDFQIDKMHYRSIGFPILLALTGSSETPTRVLYLASLILYFFSVYIISLFLLRLKLKFSLVFLFSLILAMPFFVQNSAMVMSENFTTFTLVTGFIFFIKGFLLKNNIYLILSGLFWGFSALIRPTFQFLILPILLIIFLYLSIYEKEGILLTLKKTIQRSFFLLLGFIVLIFLNSAFNHIYFKYFGLTPVLGVILSTRTVNFVEDLPDNYKMEREILVKHRDRSLVRGVSHTALVYIEDALPELMDSTKLNFLHLSKRLEKISLLLIKKSPMKYLRSVGIAGVSFWFPFATDLVTKNKITEYLNIICWGILVFIFFSQFLLTVVLLISLILPLAFIRKDLLLFLYSHRKYIISLLVINVIIFYNFFVTIFLNVGEPRHRSPTDIFIIMSIFLVTGIFIKFRNHLKNKRPEVI